MDFIKLSSKAYKIRQNIYDEFLYTATRFHKQYISNLRKEFGSSKNIKPNDFSCEKRLQKRTIRIKPFLCRSLAQKIKTKNQKFLHI